MTRAEFGAVARLARRTARREWKRTLLIVLLIAVPVAAAITTAGLIRANTATDEELARAEFGSADVIFQTYSFSNEGNEWVEAELQRLDAAADFEAFRTVHSFVTADSHADLTDVDLTNPLTSGRVELIAGAPPATTDEVALSSYLSDEFGVGVGDFVSLHLGDTEPQPVVVSGIVTEPLWTKSRLVVVSDERMNDIIDRWHRVEPYAGVTETWLVATTLPDGVDESMTWSWQQVSDEFKPGDASQPRPAELGSLPEDVYLGLSDEDIAFLVEAAATVQESELHEIAWSLTDPAIASQIPHFQTDTLARRLATTGRDPHLDSLFGQPQVIATLMASLLLAEVAFVAGAAYATGARRRLHEIGLLGSNGATRPHIALVVVGEGFAVGILGSALGAAIGLGIMTAGQPILQHFVNRLIVGLPLTLFDVAGPMVVGVLAATVAAWLPARTASRVSTTTALQGRMPLRDPHRGLPLLSIVGVIGGVMSVGVAREMQGDRAQLAGGAGVLLMIAGAAMLTGPLVAVGGRMANGLRASARLVLRDSARQRTRAASAIAATMVVLIAPIVIGVGIGNQQALDATHGLPEPKNHVVVNGQSTYGAISRFTATDADVSRVQAVLPPSQVAMMEMLDTAALLETEQSVLGWPHGLAQSHDRFEHGRAVIGTAELAEILGDPRIVEILDRGEAVVLGRVERSTFVTLDRREVTAVELPVSVLHRQMPRILVPQDVVDAMGIETVGTTALITTEDSIDRTDRQAVWNTGLWVQTHDGQPITRQQYLYIVFGITLLLVLLIIALVTALSATESDHDVRLMVAIGAPPAMRRRFLGLQAGFYVLVGALLAVPLSLLMMKVLIARDLSMAWGPFGTVARNLVTIPWMAMAFVVLALPAFVAATTALFVRSAPTVPPRPAG